MKTSHTEAFNKIMAQYKDKPKKEKPMKPTTLNPDHALSASLSKCTIQGNVLSLPPITEPLPDYAEIRKALINAGGKYQRSKFIFSAPVLPYLERITEGEKVNIKKEFQFFATPQRIAERMVEMADIELYDTILEPSAGQGAIIEAIINKHPSRKKSMRVTAFELMEINRDILRKKEICVLTETDFLNTEVDWSESFSRIIANPPFSKNQDIDHIYKMYKCLTKGGRIVTIASKHWQFAQGKKEKAFKQWLEDVNAVYEDIPAGEFTESGTKIATCLIVIDKPENEQP